MPAPVTRWGLLTSDMMSSDAKSCVQAAGIVEDTWRICAGNGDYATLQRENEMEFCADKDDGWQVRDNIILQKIRKELFMFVRCRGESLSM